MYFTGILIAIDQLINAILGGPPDETISARAWRNRSTLLGKYLVVLIDKIFWFDPSHCETSFESEVIRRYLPEIYAACFTKISSSEK